jgi:hypothetical protein
MKRQPFEKANHIYSIEFTDRVSEPRIYRVKITGEANRDFFVEVDPSQNARDKVETGIQEWCERNFRKLPKDGGTIAIDLDENRRE